MPSGKRIWLTIIENGRKQYRRAGRARRYCFLREEMQRKGIICSAHTRQGPVPVFQALILPRRSSLMFQMKVKQRKDRTAAAIWKPM